MTVIASDYNLIYLKTRKTAGTSTELHLVRRLGESADHYRSSIDLPQHGVSRGRGEYKGWLPMWGTVYWGEEERRGLWSLMPHSEKLRQHADAAAVRRFVGEAFWGQAVKVCNVRNPWEMTWSYWRWQARGRDGRAEPLNLSFAGWLRAAISEDPEERGRLGVPPLARLFHDYAYSGGQWIVDHMIPFESLQSSLAELGERIGLALDGMDVHCKRSNRERPHPYREDYRHDWQVAVVEEHFSDLIERMGYRF